MNQGLQHILIVDNDLLFLKHISFLLHEKNYKYTAVSNASEALKFLANDVFDLVISDLFMPGIDGLQFLSQVRALKEYKYTPFIIITSAFHEEVIVKLLTNGADDVIFKPLSSSVFFTKIEAAFARNQFKKDLYNVNFKNNLNLDTGTGVYCCNPLDTLFDSVDIPLERVTDYDSMLDINEKKNIWFVVINSNATWAVELFSKIKKLIGMYCPVILLPQADTSIADANLFDYVIPSCFHIDKAADFFSFILQREVKLKSKYINALSLASSRSPFVVEQRVERRFGDFLISVFHEPLEQIPGGDFYEILPCNDELCVIVFGDVMGKAWDAWFLVPAYIAYVRSVLRLITDPASDSKISSPAALLEMLNAYLYKDFKLSNVFTTLQIVFLNKENNSLKIASAGALSPFFKGGDAQNSQQVGTSGKLLGLDIASKYSDYETVLSKNDVCIMITDGYNDVTTDKGHTYVKQGEISTLIDAIPQNQLVSSPFFDKRYQETLHVNFFNDDRTCVMISVD